jgi:phthiocerol/phenolphthiocerol synthesis type-I polyketide synthase C
MRVAVVGMGFRFPGGICDEPSFWRVLSEGLDVVSAIPEERWGTNYYGHPKRGEPGKSITWSAGVIDQSGAFDAPFFGISPREANNLDPQQRLLLELTWEALENGGQIPCRLAGSDCAVYVGISGTDYGLRSLDDLSSVDAYTMTGNTLSVAANRISYTFDFRGPSMAIDTACSSAIVALHLACKSLREGEASTAVVGAVNMLLHPYPFVGFTKASMLSAHGRCRAFDAAGDGYVRSEGAGVLFLKPLEQALADGDPVHAVILASGVNSDGHKNGITIPSAAGQSRLLQATCRQAGISPDEIAYIEAHGTGTAVGDPVETAAIGDAVASRRSKESPPLFIGSVKTNIGHLESASGMAGIIKAVLCLKHRALPPSLHLETPNPNIDFQALNLKVVTELVALPETKARTRIGVNSFGFGGTNGHVLLEDFSGQKHGGRTISTLTPPLFLSARSPQALRELASRYASLMDCNTEYYDIAYGATHRRQWLTHRLAVFGKSSDQLQRRLEDFSHGQQGKGILLEDMFAEPIKNIAFVYSGNGAQWLGMGRSLLCESREFGSAVQQVDALFEPMAGYSIIQQLLAEEADSRLHLTQIAQPALFAVQVGITCVLRSLGLEAQAVLGHSVGEVAAAWAAGALNLTDAVRVVYERSMAQATTWGSGKMAAVSLSAAEAQTELERAGLTGKIEIAALNSPVAVSLSGETADLVRFQQILEPQGVFFRILDLEYAFHSRKMDGLEAVLKARLADLAPTATQLRFISTVTGAEFPGESLQADYWWRNIREPVQLDKAASLLIKDGIHLFIEIGPHAVLLRYLGESFHAHDVAGRAIPTLYRNDDGLDRLHDTVCRALLLGCDSDLSRLFPHPGNPVELPAYPWQRERYWYNLTSEGYDLVNRHRDHPLLGYRLKDAEASWENDLDLQLLPYLQDHVVGGAVVLPAAAYVEMALAASRAWLGAKGHEVEALEIRAPVVFDGDHARTLRFEITSPDGSFQIKSRERLSTDEWRMNVVGRLVGGLQHETGCVEKACHDLANWKPNFSSAEHYALAKMLGLDYGPAFQSLLESRVESNTVLARIRAPQDLAHSQGEYMLHPVLLDTCFQSLFDLFRDKITADSQIVLLPVGVGRLRWFDETGTVVQCHSVLKKRGPRSALAEFHLLDAAGNIVALLENCRFRGVVLSRNEAPKPSTWQYHLVAMSHPASSAKSIPACVDLIGFAQSQLADQEANLYRNQHYQRFVPLLEALAVAFAHEALHHLVNGEDVLKDDWITDKFPEDSLRLQLLNWVLQVLEQGGVVQRHPEGWSIVEGASLPSAQEVWLSLLGEGPAYLPDLVLAGRAGFHLPAVLDGSLDGEQLGYSLSASALNEQWVESSPTYAGINVAAWSIIERLAEDWPRHQRLRILDVSQGQGAMARRLLPLLPVDRYDYLLAAMDEQSLAGLEGEFGHHKGVSFTLVSGHELQLSEEVDGARQGFDVVLIGHVLHKVEDLHKSVLSLRKHMVEDSLLLVLEREPDAAANLVSGLNPEWWRPSHGGRRVSSLMEKRAWEKLLEECGFHDVASLSEPASAQTRSGVFAILAKAPAREMPGESETTAASWLVLSDARGRSRALAEGLVTKLRTQGQRALLALGGKKNADVQANEGVLVWPDLSPEGAVDLIADTVAALEGCDHVVHLLGLDAADDEPMLAQELRCESTLHLVRAIEGSGLPTSPRLWLVTRGGAVVNDAAKDTGISLHNVPSQSALWGFGRVLMNEHPALSCTLIDLQTPLDGNAVARLSEELTHPDEEDEIILVQEGRYAARMSSFAMPSAVQTSANAGAQLDFHLPGQLRNLHWHSLPERELQADEIEIQPMAVGLNFRDIMYTMGLLGDEAVENGFAGASLGMELAGVVTRTGSAVDEFEVGDAVVAFAPSSFATRAITKATSATQKPQSWTFEEAATVPTTFFTAYYALHYLARVQPGEKVLIHGAAGGVGIAAIQVASYLGAEVFATAGSDEKRDFLALLGADHIMDSRSLDFADEILAITDGQGIDVVLNSLAGEAINRNFRILRPFGRFLELGKRDFYENTRVGLRPFKDNISYFGIDADQLMVERPSLAADLFREVMGLFENGMLRPLPYRAFPAPRVVDAFRYMQQSRQIGKIVVTFDGTPLPIVTPAKATKPLLLSRDATYLVTGGIGGFGLKTALWFAQCGAGHLVLLSRRGADAPDAEQARVKLEALGAHVHFRACDVTDFTQLNRVINEINSDLPALKGVVHAAMVLDDGLIRNLDANRLRRVMAPKIQGAWNLHRATLGLSLDLFVLYSSATTFIGNPGQANYVAANMYLEALALLRRSQGLPATCVAWGAISDVGYLARNQEIKDALQSRLGGQALSSDKALEELGEMLQSDASGIGVIDFDWHTLQRLLPSAQAPRYVELRRMAGPAGVGTETNQDICNLLAGRTPEEAQTIISELLREEVAAVLRLPKERVDIERSLYDLGMDSLMGVELVLGIEQRFGVSLPVMALSEAPTIKRITERVAKMLQHGGENQSGDQDDLAAMVSRVAAQHAVEASESEVAHAVEALRANTVARETI